MKKIFLLVLFLLAALPVRAQTVTFLEAGTDSTFDVTMYTTSCATSSTTAHTGPRSLSLSTGAGPSTCTADTPTGILSDSGTQINFWFQFNTAPTGSNAAIVTARQAGGPVWSVTLTTSRTLTMDMEGGTDDPGATVLSTGTWYRITVSYYFDSTVAYQSRLYINGALEATTNAGTMTRIAPTFLRMAANLAIGTNRTFLYDDLYIATGGASSAAQPDTGNILVTAKRPFANGTVNDFTTEIGAGPAPNGTGSGHAPNVSERALSTSFGWSILGAGSEITEEYNVQAQDVGDVNVTGTIINGVVGWVYAAVAAGTESGSIITQNATSSISLTTTPTMFTKVGTATYPAGTGTDVGIITSTGATTFSLYEAGIMVAYTQRTSCSMLLLGAC